MQRERPADPRPLRGRMDLVDRGREVRRAGRLRTAPRPVRRIRVLRVLRAVTRRRAAWIVTGSTLRVRRPLAGTRDHELVDAALRAPQLAGTPKELAHVRVRR